MPDCIPVTGHASPVDRQSCRIGDHRVRPPLLALFDVGDVNLNRRNVDRRDGIGDGARGVAQGARVDDDPVDVGALEKFDDFAFVICLREIDFDAHPGRPRVHSLFEVGEGVRPVDLRLPRAQEVQVRSVDHLYPHVTLPLADGLTRVRGPG